MSGSTCKVTRNNYGTLEKQVVQCQMNNTSNEQQTGGKLSRK